MLIGGSNSLKLCFNDNCDARWMCILRHIYSTKRIGDSNAHNLAVADQMAVSLKMIEAKYYHYDPESNAMVIAS